MQQADYIMLSTHSMNAKKCVQAQKPYPSHAFSHESSKVGGREKIEERDREEWQPNKTKKSSPERKAAQQNKNLSEELKQGLPRHSSG